MKKQTAVEWLVDELRMRYDSGALDAISISILKMRAKAMEKEQMLDAYNAGKDDHHHMSYAEQYYNETYK
jgi:hypothetical protein